MTSTDKVSCTCWFEARIRPLDRPFDTGIIESLNELTLTVCGVGGNREEFKDLLELDRGHLLQTATEALIATVARQSIDSNRSRPYLTSFKPGQGKSFQAQCSHVHEAMLARAIVKVGLRQGTEEQQSELDEKQ